MTRRKRRKSGQKTGRLRQHIRSRTWSSTFSFFITFSSSDKPQHNNFFFYLTFSFIIMTILHFYIRCCCFLRPMCILVWFCKFVLLSLDSPFLIYVIIFLLFFSLPFRNSSTRSVLVFSSSATVLLSSYLFSLPLSYVSLLSSPFLTLQRILFLSPLSP